MSIVEHIRSIWSVREVGIHGVCFVYTEHTWCTVSILGVHVVCIVYAYLVYREFARCTCSMLGVELADLVYIE